MVTGVNLPGGLSEAEVRERVAAGQVNAAPPAPGRTIGQIMRANVLTRFNAILGVLFVLVMIVGPPQDALFGVLLAVNTSIGVAQELRAKRALDKLAILTAARARVLRDGTVREIAQDQVVLDDLLDLRRGDQVPVDAAVVRAEGLELDEALLTGEAEPVPKRPGETVLSGSFVVAGTGRARVTAVGGQSYAMRLQAQARRFSVIRSEIQQGTNQILRLVTWVMIPAGLLLVISEFFRSHLPFAEAVRGSAAGVSGMVPEGLVLLTSIAFAAGALRLARRRVLVSELAAIEGLARVDVLCTDKTGTLTRPGMRLAATEVLAGQPAARIGEVLAAVAAADDNPNPTVRAIAARYTQPPGWTVRARVPFSSARKWSGVSFAGHGTWLLGAPGVVSPALPAGVAASVARHEAEGRRVLLLAATAAPLAGGQPPAGAEPAALVVLAEELREEAARTVRYLAGQGVTIKVLSGDAPRAVAAIARRAGLPEPGDPVDASGLTSEQMADAIATADVFGRVQPAQKLAAVKALQAAGHVVAMIGDGVNDVQALKQADLGIAMGSGSDASRSVARVVLLDGTFAAVPELLGEARRVIANIERVAWLFVTKTAYSAIIAVSIGAVAIPFPFYPRHLTIVSTLAIGVPGFFLALAAGAPRAAPGFTRRVLSFTIPAGIVAAAATLGSYALARGVAGISVQAARTAAMLALLAVSLWVLGIVAGRAARRITLVPAMAACIVPLFAVPQARSTFAVQLPPPGVLLQVAVIVAAAIAGLTVWRRVRPVSRPTAGSASRPRPSRPGAERAGRRARPR
ncbi:MAG TPA: HAD-IC family P-type ATPase [Trebonia sp.]|nr:HAD-IC family P-type ATPase [Trebonia sp.]